MPYPVSSEAPSEGQPTEPWGQRATSFAFDEWNGKMSEMMRKRVDAIVLANMVPPNALSAE